MTLQLVYRPEVRDEVDHTYAWYEGQRRGLGEEFLASARDLLADIEKAPALAPVIHRDVRVRLLRRFPYAVYYRMETDRILVVAIQHGRRSPRRWKSRL